MFDESSSVRAESNHVSRRLFVGVGAAALAGVWLRARHDSGRVEAMTEVPRDVQIVTFSTAGVRGGVVTVPTLVKSDADWKKQLSAGAYDVMRHDGTEFPYTGKYWDMHDKGMYQCAGCATALFSSATKFESGTGWPSFWEPIAKENVAETRDDSMGMGRTAVSCKRCDAHLGHVFDDGPQPTGLRYCMNSVAMEFVKS